MKAISIALLLPTGTTAFAQSKRETALKALSSQIFQWEVGSHFDSLENVLHKRLVVLSSAGVIQSKAAYLARLKGGNFVHNSINVEESDVVIEQNTGTVTGKGLFDVTVDGKQTVLHLAYLEVFTRSTTKSAWKLLALHASVIPESK
ncbi:nuclear transport factor 2 family protein [Mucilaginibacter sp. Mucisp84]|uniref:nuclear transport factor 2 family protein n=1 Tax=Mucilaginibacter sp. Mucisp84 TaxID=3243058 RepID=UPI0039A61876